MNNYIIISIFVFGLIFGSFINCLIYRLRNEVSLWGRSFCPNCKKQINWYDNIPVFSFIILKGRCRNCKKPISWQYPLLEFLFALFATLIFINLLSDFAYPKYLSTDFAINYLRDFIFLFVLAIVFVYDFKWQEVPMIIVWPAIAIMILFSWFLGSSITTILISSAATSLFFLLQFILTKKRGVGEGDIWLGALLGARFVEASLIIFSIFSTYIIGSVVAVYLMIKFGKKLKSKVPLGPFMVVASLLTIFVGNMVVNWYLNMLNF